MSKYGVFSGPYFPVLSPNIGKYGPEKFPYLDSFHVVENIGISKVFRSILPKETNHQKITIKTARSFNNSFDVRFLKNA